MLIKITLFYSIVSLRHLYFQQSYMSFTFPSEPVNTSSFNIDFKMSSDSSDATIVISKGIAHFFYFLVQNVHRLSVFPFYSHLSRNFQTALNKRRWLVSNRFDLTSYTCQLLSAVHTRYIGSVLLEYVRQKKGLGFLAILFAQRLQTGLVYFLSLA